MRIECTEDDAPAFAVKVEALAHGIARETRPCVLFLVKVDKTGLDRTGLPFSAGTGVPARGIEGRLLHVPLFVPNPVISERRFDPHLVQRRLENN
jgi:hypothetical protein